MADNRLYIKSAGQVIEVSLFAGGKSLTAVGRAGTPTVLALGKAMANVLPQASHLYKGCLIQNLLGAIYCSFFPNSGKSYQVRLSELDNHKIISASFDNQVLIVLGFNRQTNEYDKFIFRFDLLFSNHDCRVLNNVDNREVEFIVLDTGIVVHLLEDGKVELFKNTLNNSVVRILEDSAFDDVRLAKNQNNLLLIKGENIYVAKMQ